MFGLANEVARDIKEDFPDSFVGVYSYSKYSLTPSIDLEPNLFVQVATDISLGILTLEERIEAFAEKGVMLGIRDYYDISKWINDLPITGLNLLLDRIKYYADNNARVYNAESSDGWGRSGLLYYAASKLYWDPSADRDAILDDFYTKAFGPASAPMKSYYERISSGIPRTDRALALMFRDLDEAQTLAAGDEAILERIRQVQYYARYVWLRTIFVDPLVFGAEQVAVATDTYLLISKTRYQYVLDWRNREPSYLAFLQGAGVSGAEIDALKDYTAPTPQEAQAWMDEALDYFFDGTTGVFPSGTSPIDAPVIEIANLDLVPFGANDEVVYEWNRLRERQMLIPATAGSTVTIDFKFFTDGVFWKDSNDKIIQAIPGDGEGIHEFYAPKTDVYRLACWCRVEPLSNHPVGITVTPTSGRWIEKFSIFYFYVPTNTPAFIMGVDRTTADNPEVRIFDPDFVKVIDEVCTVVTYCEYGMENPADGLWTLVFDAGSSGSNYYLLGVPALTFHDPAKLAVPRSLHPRATEVADLQVTHAALPAQVLGGGEVTLTTTVTNNGPADSTWVHLTDTLPENVDIVSATPTQGSCSNITTLVTCNLGNIDNGANVTVDIVVKPMVTGTLSSVVSITAIESDNAPGNDSDTKQTMVLPAVDLSVAISDSLIPALLENDLTYTVTVTNNGVVAATGVVMTDTIPAFADYVSSSPSQGDSCGEVAGIVTCNLGTISNGANATVDIVVNPTATGTLSNLAGATAIEADPDTGNNAVVHLSTVDPAADLSVTISDSPDPVTVGNSLTYTITVSNNGPLTSTAVSLTSPLLESVTYISATPTQGSCGPTVVEAVLLVTFQEGVAGYASTVDTEIRESEPATGHGVTEFFGWDTDTGSGQEKIALIRFDDIFGSGPGQIPPGATIQEATLTYVVSNPGDPANIREVLIGWVRGCHVQHLWWRSWCPGGRVRHPGGLRHWLPNGHILQGCHRQPHTVV